jgi:hypothetical protein
MHIKIQLIVLSDDDQEQTLEEVVTLEKEFEHLEQIGLTLTESKNILKQIQQTVIERQIAAYLKTHRQCERCGKRHKLKSYHEIVFRTLFGNIRLKSPRLYHCQCQKHRTKSFSPLVELLAEHTAPELLYLETKWASLVSYDKTAELLKEVLPIDDKINAATVRNHLHRVAQRKESKLGEERVFFIDGCPRDWEKLPASGPPITVGMDGGYVRDWRNKKSHFEVIVGKSVPARAEAKAFGFVQTYDKKPKRRLFELLRSQGLNANQELVFMSDGEETLRGLQEYLSPHSTQLLDWFHITMRITVLRQYAKGLIRIDPRLGGEIDKELERVKWYLWHGNVYEALFWLGDIEMLIYNFEESYTKFAKLEKALEEFHVYIKRNAASIENYGLRWHRGEVISTAFMESTVNQVISKRFCKKQQMQWTPKGAHLLLQMRTAVLNNELEGAFRTWYPNFRDDTEEKIAA